MCLRVVRDALVAQVDRRSSATASERALVSIEQVMRGGEEGGGGGGGVIRNRPKIHRLKLVSTVGCPFRAISKIDRKVI